ncbi:MAG TPA: universal stress protein [Rhizobiales bacterium]|nr:universal stress protein [Hyphomicrobiales bacterium]
MNDDILCCVNGSAHARRAVEIAVEFARGLDRRLSFVLVNQVRPASGFPPIKSWTEAEGEEILDAAVRYARVRGVKGAKRILFEGADVAASILECARRIDAGHIVVGTGNPPFVGRLLIGSVSEAVVSGAGCSVTVAR